MKLTVKPLLADRSGETAAIVERGTMADLGLESGDYAVVEGPTGESIVTQVTSRPSEETGDRILRLVPDLAEAIGVTVGETVRVEPVTVRSAERIEIALPEGVGPEEAIELSRRDALVGDVLSSGRTTAVPIGDGPDSEGPTRRVPIEIVDVEPDGYVRVEEWTSIVAAPEPASVSVGEGTPEAASSGDESGPATDADATYDDIGGLDDELEQVREVVELPMRHPDLFDRLGVEPPTGVLLSGPPGTGKTLIARALANEVGAHFQTISGPEIVSKYYGESEERLREIFEEAAAEAPAIVFVDEIDAIAPGREDVAGDVERRIVAQLLSLLDGADDRGQVVVVGTTNRVDAVDPALRRPGRFDREIEIGVPDADERAEILRIHARDVTLADSVDLERYAESTHGFVGADLENLIRESAMCALRRAREGSSGDDAFSVDRPDAIEIVGDDVDAALRGIEPSAMREVVAEVPDTGWEDVGGLAEAKRTLREAVQWPLEYPDAFERVSLRPATGILLHGPPGTGKTLLTRAVATEAKSNYISVEGPELVDKYVGESERGIRKVFGKARENAPAVLVFDEIDAIAGTRGGSAESDVGERVVSQLLTELDGLEDLEDVVVVATTNRPDRIDDALLRTGRFERHVSVGAPDEPARREIFEIHLRDRPLAPDVDIGELAARTDGLVGSDIEGVCRRAAMDAVREHVEGGCDEGRAPVREIALTRSHFERALEAVDREGPGGTDRE